ncbi:MAG TPA: hypothetical protein VGB18_03630 [Candidatus Thermoplasmatota archaeon]
MRGFHQELAHFVVHHRSGTVLWCDGEHGMNPYDFAELNLERGYDADFGSDRVLVKRCMTPFQWDTVLTKQLDQKLMGSDTSLVLVAPYDQLFSTDELKDWEQEDYVAFSLKHLKSLAQRHKVPIVLSVDMARWWKTHPILARMAFEQVDSRWSIARLGNGWRAVKDDSEATVETLSQRQVTLRDFVPKVDVKSPVEASLPPLGRS